MSFEQLFAGLRLDEDKKKQRIDEWKQKGSVVPQPFVANQVSADFMLLGSYVFNGSRGQSADFGADRAAFNEQARIALPALMDLVLNLNRLPESIRDLLIDYARSVSKYTSL